MNKQSIAFIVPYFGTWPVWFPGFLISCSFNPSIQWIFFSDCDIPDVLPPNVLIYKTTMGIISKKVFEKTGVKVNLKHPVKFCDLKPAYGHIFEEYLIGYDFWGFCDIDIIWGDIKSFLSDDILKKYDVISSRKHTISGHFTLMRNSLLNKTLYKKYNLFKRAFESKKYMWFDETTFADIVKSESDIGAIKVWWDEYLVNHEHGRDSHQDYYLDRWLFEKGKLYDLGRCGQKKKENMYLHFINWKKTMKYCEVLYEEEEGYHRFYISYCGLHLNPHHKIVRCLNDYKNKFFGYYVREFIRIKKNKITKRCKKKILRIKTYFCSLSDSI